MAVHVELTFHWPFCSHRMTPSPWSVYPTWHVRKRTVSLTVDVSLVDPSGVTSGPQSVTKEHKERN